MPATPAAGPAIHSQRLLPVLALLFIGSGCAALVYEIVWLQMLQLVIGSTAISLGVLLGTFMGGMCVGSLLLPRLIPPGRHPLRVYAWLELGIGVMAIGLLYGMPYIEQLYTAGVGHGTPSVLLRAVLGVLCLLPPTLLMGATLPAIARWVESTPSGVSWLGFFYGGNIVGAVFGCLLAGFYLLRLYDMAVATYVAFAINIAVSLSAFLLSAFTKYEAAAPAPRSDRPPRADGTRVAYVVIAISGLTGLGAEVVWTRLLSLTLGATVYTFSIILAVFLFGLGIGSGIGAIVSRSTPRPRILLGVCQLLLAGAIAWTALCISRALPYLPIDVGMVSGMKNGPWLTFQLDLMRCIWTILPAAVLWGASFPLALASVTSRGKDPGRVVGGVYAANTIGAIFGALIFSMILIPVLGRQGMGTRDAERILIVLTTISAALALTPRLRAGTSPGSPRGRLRVAPVAVTALVGLATAGAVGWLVAKVEPLPPVAVAYGRFSASHANGMADGVFDEKLLASAPFAGLDRCIYVGEGMNVSVAVTVSPEGYRYFHGAGKVQASSDPRDMRLQRMLGHIAALTFPKHSPENVLVVACGAGVTAGSFIPYDSVKRIVICDIEPLVPTRVTPMFGPQNYHIVDGIDKQNPHMVDGHQVEVVYDDGRHFVRTTREKFDVITSDPIDPWVKGCAALNTVEYYRMCKDHLTPGGVMALWIPFYESNTDTAKSVLGTFFKVFPNGIVWSNDNGRGGYDAVLFGQVEPTRINLDETQTWIDAHPRVKLSLKDVGFGAEKANDSPGVAVDLFASYAGQATRLTEWLNGAQINTDRNLRLQYLAGMWVNLYVQDDILNGILKHYAFPDDVFTGSDVQIRSLRRTLENAGRTPRKAVAASDKRVNP
jgi:spermidine synthase